MNRRKTFFLITSEKYLEKNRKTGALVLTLERIYLIPNTTKDLTSLVCKIISIPGWDLKFPLVQSIQMRYLKQNCTGNYSQDTPIDICTLAWE